MIPSPHTTFQTPSPAGLQLLYTDDVIVARDDVIESRDEATGTEARDDATVPRRRILTEKLPRRRRTTNGIAWPTPGTGQSQFAVDRGHTGCEP